jgi:hypothetical protein
MDGLQPCLMALRAAANSRDPYRRIVVERQVDSYLRSEPFSLENALKRLGRAIDFEEAAKRQGEDWREAREYVRTLRQMVAF